MVCGQKQSDFFIPLTHSVYSNSINPYFCKMITFPFKNSIFFLLCVLTLQLGAQNFQESTLIVKLKRENRQLFSNGKPDHVKLVELWQKMDLTTPERLFQDNHENPESGQIDVTLIYEVSYSNNYSPLKLGLLLNKTGFFEYAEPRYIGRLAFAPNDTRYIQQSYLQAIGAEQAWDSTKGSSSIIIGLLDGGVDTNHEDFQGKFYLNSSDSINGLDDDSDGYTDNFKGWNFDTKTDNIQYSSTSHGVQMAGAMAPVTNNTKGIAGVGYNSMILPIVVTNSLNEVVYGYEAIKYAADMGCKVINCSWNIKAYSNFGFDMVKYATLNKGSLVVAAMGNEGDDDNNYPAMFPYVLGVSAVDNNGFKVGTSNYGFKANISAPGLQIETTNNNNGYIKNTGTSLSSAIVSGAAALLMDKFPNLNPQELSAVLKSTSKNIYGNGQNGQYLGMLGTGMLHIGNAVAYTGSAYPELVKTKINEPVNGVVESGDTIEVIIDVANYLATSSNVTAILNSENLYSTVLLGTQNLGIMNKNDTVSNSANPFKVRIKSTAPQNEKLGFSLRLVENGDTSIFAFDFIANTAYQIIETSKIKTALGNRGTFGWYRYSQKEGVGFTYKGGSQLLYEGGLLVGMSRGGVVVADRIRGVRDVEQTDFTTINALNRSSENGIPFSLEGKFTDTTSKNNKLELIITQKAFAWPGEVSRENFMILEYTLKSLNSYTIDLHVGLLADWDIEDFDKNRAEYDGFRYLAYTHSTEGIGPYCGVQLLNNTDRRKAYSIDHINGGAGGIDIADNDVFSKVEKFITLSTNREKAGNQSGGNDVLQIMGTGFHSLKTGDSLVVQFAVLAADNLKDLQNAADTAFWIMNNRVPDLLEEKNKLNNSLNIYPNPAPKLVNLLFVENFTGQVEVYSLSGKLVLETNIENQKTQKLDISELVPGSYYLRVNSNKIVFVKKLIKY